MKKKSCKTNTIWLFCGNARNSDFLETYSEMAHYWKKGVSQLLRKVRRWGGGDTYLGFYYFDVT